MPYDAHVSAEPNADCRQLAMTASADELKRGEVSSEARSNSRCQAAALALTVSPPSLKFKPKRAARRQSAGSFRTMRSLRDGGWIEVRVGLMSAIDDWLTTSKTVATRPRAR
jgi:hypothetical protein